MKKIIIVAILIIAQNQIMAQAKKEVPDDQNPTKIAQFNKENKARIQKEKQDQANYEVRMHAVENKSYIEPVAEELKHKNKKPLDKSSATGAPAVKAITPTEKSNE